MGRSQIGQAEGTRGRHIEEQFQVMKHGYRILGNNIRGRTGLVWSNQSSKGVVQPGEEAAFQIAAAVLPIRERHPPVFIEQTRLIACLIF